MDLLKKLKDYFSSEYHVGEIVLFRELDWTDDLDSRGISVSKSQIYCRITSIVYCPHGEELTLTTSDERTILTGSKNDLLSKPSLKDLLFLSFKKQK